MDLGYEALIFFILLLCIFSIFHDILVKPIIYNNYLNNCYDNYIVVLELCLQEGVSQDQIPSILKYFKSIKEKNQDYMVAEYIVSLFKKRYFLKGVVKDLNQIEDLTTRRIIKQKIKDTNNEYNKCIKQLSIVYNIGVYCERFIQMRKM